MAYVPISMPGALSLKAAGLVAASAFGTALRVGHGTFEAILTWTACETDTGNELYVVILEANSLAAPTVWNQIGALFVGGHTGADAGLGTTAATGAIKQAFLNPYDYQIRYHIYVAGTVATGFNFAIDVHPSEVLKY